MISLPVPLALVHTLLARGSSYHSHEYVFSCYQHLTSTFLPDWPQEDSTDPAASSANGTAATSATTHLWEESWDDDEDGNEEFSKALK